MEILKIDRGLEDGKSDHVHNNNIFSRTKLLNSLLKSDTSQTYL
jgi:hypothetical protein